MATPHAYLENASGEGLTIEGCRILEGHVRVFMFVSISDMCNRKYDRDT